ncbi:MAG: 4-phosphoerythronate dehydrogenase [Muribaculaceae bacterium]|nr:4-phosphoerythronate dehydrogenase [Muribaculaceae bacterium]
MKIAIDPNIPFIVEPLQEIQGIEITHNLTRQGVKDADAIVVRTRTCCDASLLEGSKCSFVGTATIGTDHIDLAYCKNRGIKAVSAPGCNAPAVAQWVLAAIRESGGFEGRTLGVVGAGNVGSILIRWATSLGMNVLVNDPPLQKRGDNRWIFSTLSEIVEKSDVISFHTPLTRQGEFPTFHLVDASFISQLKRSPILLNAARGPVTDTAALLEGLASGKISGVGIDCWEGEPQIDRRLLENALIATPHIAGYSMEGKIRATQMMLDALTSHFGLDPLRVKSATLNPVPDTLHPEDIDYDILADTDALKQEHERFEELRNKYSLRHEPGQS